MPTRVTRLLAALIVAAMARRRPREPAKKFVANGACGEVADEVLAQCKCRRTLTTKFDEVCVERCCAARRRRKRGKGGTHLMGWLHRKKHRPGYRSTRAVDDK